MTENITLKEKQVYEALKRLEMLGLDGYCTENLKNSGMVFYSKDTPFGAFPYMLSSQQEFVSFVKAFEERSGSFVYHCTHEYTGFGECLTMLYVSKYEDEWEADRELLEEGNKIDGFVQYAYVENISEPLFSEIGTVQVKNSFYGLIRTA